MKTQLSLTALHLVAHFGLIEMITRLLKLGAVADNSTTRGPTPLSMAAERGRHRVVKLLSNRDDVDVNFKDEEGQTPLY